MEEVSLHLLADRPDLIPAAGELRWREWGHPPEPVERSFWVDVTGREAGRDGLPATWVACAADGDLVGAVGIGEFDLDTLRDRTPWVMGMLVREDWRRAGIGRRLLAMLDPHARALGYDRIWVATGETAAHFYRACGYEPAGEAPDDYGRPAHILVKTL